MCIIYWKLQRCMTEHLIEMYMYRFFPVVRILFRGGLNSIPESFAFLTILSKFEVTSSVSLRAQTKRIVKDGGQLRNVL